MRERQSGRCRRVRHKGRRGGMDRRSVVEAKTRNRARSMEEGFPQFTVEEFAERRSIPNPYLRYARRIQTSVVDNLRVEVPVCRSLADMVPARS